MSSNDEHCAALVREADRDRYLATLFAPAGRRAALYALYAFDIETARVRCLVNEPMTGTIRLQWWLEAVRGERSDEAAANPVMAALVEALRGAGIESAAVARIVEARQGELYGERAVVAAAAVLTLAARLLGAGENLVAAAAGDAARALTSLDDPLDYGQARESYAAFREKLGAVPGVARPAFLPAALVPMRLRHPQAGPWRRQIALLRAAWFGFPKL